MTAQQRARELAQFFGMTEADALAKLNLGFGYHHAEVTADWKRANPQTDDEILEWYRKTDKYCWELSAYHLDPGFNYMGMCAGISEALRAKGVNSVICLGDGIGDLTMRLRSDGIDGCYHDLHGSRTAQFAESRFAASGMEWIAYPTLGWEPFSGRTGPLHVQYDAIVSLDFLEHVTNVEQWLRAIFSALKPGGWFLGQNAFGIGSTKDGGSMPMHPDRNDRFETEYGPLMLEIGFVQEGTSKLVEATRMSEKKIIDVSDVGRLYIRRAYDYIAGWGGYLESVLPGRGIRRRDRRGFLLQASRWAGLLGWIGRRTRKADRQGGDYSAMTPAISPLSDDRDKALACIEDVWKFCQAFKIGLFARQGERLQIALSDPRGTDGKPPVFLQQVTEWRDFANVATIDSNEIVDHADVFTGALSHVVAYRALEILTAIGQVMHHYNSRIISAPIQGVPTMLLCDSLPDGQWRAYAVIAELNCYRRKDRGIKPQVTM